MTTTYGDLLSRRNIEIPPHLVAQAEVPVLTGPQRQGDLFIVPVDGAPRGTVLAPVPQSGVQVVHGEATGNTHWLDGGAGVSWARLNERTVVVQVADGAVATLTHTDEHGANAMGPGSYEVRRKVEWAEELRLVSD